MKMACRVPPSNSIFSTSRITHETRISEFNPRRRTPTTTVFHFICKASFDLNPLTTTTATNKQTTPPRATTTTTTFPSDERTLSTAAARSGAAWSIKLWGRTWNLIDLSNVVMIGIPHVLTLFAPFTFSWAAFRVAVVLAAFTGFGLTFSYHRNLSHRSFKLPKWLEYFFAYCAVHALEKDPMFWVSHHRYHHMYADTERDPHSPNIDGFWFGHIGWLFDSQKLATKCGEARPGEYSNVADLKKQPFYVFLHRTYFVHPIALATLLYMLGGFPFLVWGMGVRAVWVYQSSFISGSLFHMWGKREWKTNDLSKNNWFLAITNLGEGFHNTHHAFPYSARVGLKWWEIDMTWYLIRFFELIGLATNVKLPLEKDIRAMAIPS